MIVGGRRGRQMEITLTPESEKIIDDFIASGLYQTVDEVVIAAVTLLMKQKEGDGDGQ